MGDPLKYATPPASSIARSHTSIPASATSRFIGHDVGNERHRGLRVIAHGVQDSVERPSGDAEACVHQADLSLHDDVIVTTVQQGQHMITGTFGDAEIDSSR